MKIAFAGKGGTGKTTITAWIADYLSRAGHDVWLIDADTALSLGAASGLALDNLPVPLVQREDLIAQYIGSGMISLNPDVRALPEELAVLLPAPKTALQPGVQTAGKKRLMVMGHVSGAGGGCACEANALLKALLAHLVYDRHGYVLVDLEAGVEHLGRGTIAAVDALVVVSEPSWRSLHTASDIARFAHGLGLSRQFLCLNRCDNEVSIPLDFDILPQKVITIPALNTLQSRMLHSGSVLDLPDQQQVDVHLAKLMSMLENN